MVKGYKVFNPDWTCRGFQYEVGKIFEEDVKPGCCDRGFHFCEKASDCFNYYPFNSKNKVAEIIALGDVDSNGVKSCTNKIQIVREIPWDEVLRIVNIGKDCTGLCNTGNCNAGNRNTGNCNTGRCNTGNENTGDKNAGDKNAGNWNTGNCNTGDCNTGNYNAGNKNAGNYNTGDKNAGNYNTGDYNKSSFNTGCFNTEEPNIMLFNKPSDLTYRDWLDSDACYLLNQMPNDVVEWICSEDMTDEEKAAYPTHKITGGYLKVLNKSECGQLWWNELSNYNKNIIMSIPNFDPDIFKECTGIDVTK